MKEHSEAGAENRDDARSDIGSFVDEVLELLSGARDRGQEDLSELRERVKGSAQRIKDGAAKGQRELRAAAESAAEKADDFAHENPWQLAGIAAVVGLAIGVLISRR
jgi:ElaB/YqjD/DUF883 family membrane-anchored ribosome-binding protein